MPFTYLRLLFHLLNFQWVIFWRLIRQGTKINIINLLIAIVFLVNSIAYNVHIHVFFNLIEHHVEDANDSSKIRAELCQNYIISSLVLYILCTIPNWGIILFR